MASARETSTPQRRKQMTGPGPSPEATDHSDEECVVCLEPLFDEENPAVVVQLPCRHRFHEACISKVMRYQTRITLHRTATCPCCRHQLYTVPTTTDAELQAAGRDTPRCLKMCRWCFYIAFALAVVVFTVSLLMWMLASRWR